jgi:hypothetical protein
MSNNDVSWRSIDRRAAALNMPEMERKESWKNYYVRAVDRYYDRGPTFIAWKAEGMWQNYLCEFQALFLGPSTYIYS